MPGSTSLEAQCQQVKRCVEIAVNCLDGCRHRRPTITDIILYLHEVETSIPRFVNLLSTLFLYEAGMTLIATKQKSTPKIYQLTLELVRPFNVLIDL